eukprot:TRINITY_DN1547_c0_g1_i5.p1 TRINITY_DN1547_c0_g1~~TRINITY_DN1547_c0_g1_i5.p1  ORF type:complete len:867 (+),score=202.42 TRINITY_DN1547_c0_g1_i5:212-2812(+)
MSSSSSLAAPTDKDNKGDGNSRKRKSSSSSDPSSSPRDTPPNPSLTLNPSTPTTTQLSTRFSITSSLKQTLATIIAEKQSSKPISTSNKEKLFEAVLTLIDLRQVLRSDYIALEERRKDLSRARTKWNETTVKLQNYQYERNHYLSQIQRCKQFTWSEDDLELIPLETYKLIGTPNLTPHQMMVQRLKFEDMERRKQAKTLEELKSKKEELLKKIDTQQEFLKSLPSRLEKISNLSIPLQQTLNLTISEDKTLFSKAAHFPTPLYIIFGHIHAYRGSDNTLSSWMNIRIDGKVEGAVSWASKITPNITTYTSNYSNPSTPPSIIAGPSKESEDPSQDNESDQNSLTFDQPPSPITPPPEIKKKPSPAEIYKRHPLSLVIEFKNPKDIGRPRHPHPSTTPPTSTTTTNSATKTPTTTTTSTSTMNTPLNVAKPPTSTSSIPVTTSNIAKPPTTSPSSISTTTNTTTSTTASNTSSGGSSSSSSKSTPTTPISSITNSISLKFEYIPFLDLVVVTVSGTGVIQEDRHLLCNLFPSDTGLYSPNPSHHFNAAEVGQEQNGMFVYDSSSTARPFHWVNWLAGANFPLREFPMKSIPSIYTILSFLRKRIVARQALKSQLEQLVSLNVPILDGSGISKNRDTGLKRQNTYLLATWKEVSMRDFEASGNLLEDEGIDEVPVIPPADDPSNSSRGRGLPQLPIPPPPKKIEVKLPYERTGSRYFKALLQRGESRFEAVCEVPSEYPIRPPLFKIRKYTSSRSTQPVIFIDNHCKSIETEVNIYLQEILKETGTDEVYLLTTQIRRLISCLDIHYEIMMISNNSVNSNQVTQNYVGGKQWIRSFRGRARELPVVYDPNLTLFDQRPHKKKGKDA